MKLCFSFVQLCGTAYTESNIDFMKRYLSILISLFTTIIFAQSKIAKGFILNEATKQPIPYVNISILKSQVGTSSDDDGSYSLEISEADLKNGIILTSMGYQDSILPVSQFVDQKTILLKPNTEQLNEVVISKKFEEEFLVVNPIKKRKIKGASMLTHENPWILALFFPSSANYSNYENLHKVKFYLKSTNFNKSKPSKFRVRIFETDENGLPGNDMLNESLLVETIKNQKEVVLDISNYNLKFPKNGIYIAIEWLYIPFNAFIATYKTKTEKAHNQLGYAPNLTFFYDKPKNFKTAIFASGIWFDFPMYGMTKEEVMIPAISLTLSN